MIDVSRVIGTFFRTEKLIVSAGPRNKPMVFAIFVRIYAAGKIASVFRTIGVRDFVRRTGVVCRMGKAQPFANFRGGFTVFVVFGSLKETVICRRFWAIIITSLGISAFTAA
jgi:hypothetical protein